VTTAASVRLRQSSVHWEAWSWEGKRRGGAPLAPKAPTLLQIVELHEQGLTLRQIAERLTQTRRRRPDGSFTWRYGHVDSAMRTRAYQNLLSVRNEGPDLTWEVYHAVDRQFGWMFRTFGFGRNCRTTCSCSVSTAG
jgi:hypothetical protein